jgi:hypothetical protein
MRFEYLKFDSNIQPNKAKAVPNYGTASFQFDFRNNQSPSSSSTGGLGLVILS